MTTNSNLANPAQATGKGVRIVRAFDLSIQSIKNYTNMKHNESNYIDYNPFGKG